MYQMGIEGEERTRFVASELVKKKISFKFDSNPRWLSSTQPGGTFEVEDDEAGELQQIITRAWHGHPG